MPYLNHHCNKQHFRKCFKEILVLLHYVVVGLLRIQIIIFYIVLNIMTNVEQQYICLQITRMSILLYYYTDCLILMSESIVMFLKWSIRLSQKVKDLLRLLTWFTYLNLKTEIEHVLQDFLLSSYMFFLLLIFVMMYVNTLLCVHLLYFMHLSSSI